ncbi:MAG: exo-alpha-sialidase [Thaumarchaeota archaeon]|nr:MAG: exo-alpha-sialidase [Nitrososphaerota archaeon]
MTELKLRIPKVLALVLLLSVLPLALVSQAAAGSPGFSFTTFELGRFDVPGVKCPGSTTSCFNVNAEPQIRADPAGNFYASSEYLPRVAQCSIALDLLNPQCGGTGAWKSSDNGLHYVTLPSPNTITANCSSFPCNTSFSAYGGDTDIAIASRKNSDGFYNVYVVSLERATGPLLTVEESTSRDGGQTWTINPTSIQAPLNDRPWVAAEGANKVCVSSHNVGTFFEILVSCSKDGGATFAQVNTVFDQAHLTWFAPGNTQGGNIAIDPANHVIYDTFDSIVASDAEAMQCVAPCSNNFHSVWVAVSIDGGVSFKDYLVYSNPNVNIGYNHQFSQVSVDKAGNVYSVFTDDHNAFYSFSTDFGKHWSGPILVNHSPSNTAIFPWSSAGSRGKLDIVWYGTLFDGTATPKQCSQQPCTPDNYPMSADWFVYFAQTQNALTNNPSFTQVKATSIVHSGGVCEAGVGCTGNRDLFDDFGVAASPTTGLASIVYDNDQYLNTASDPPSPTCTQDKTNSGACTRTDIATQTSGPGIFVKPKGFEIEREDLELSSSNKPEFDIEVSNTDTQEITSLSVQLNGLNVALNWNPSLPLLPGATLSASTTSLPLGLATVIGGVYSLTVTATLADGSTVTQTFSVIQTLLVGPF